jgi:hypothetical protein
VSWRDRAGAVVAVVLAPVAAQIPRWVTLGATGAVVLWMGATVEQRMTQVREAREHLDELG